MFIPRVIFLASVMAVFAAAVPTPQGVVGDLLSLNVTGVVDDVGGLLGDVINHVV